MRNTHKSFNSYAGRKGNYTPRCRRPAQVQQGSERQQRVLHLLGSDPRQQTKPRHRPQRQCLPRCGTVNLIQYDYTYDAFHRLDTLRDTRNAVVVDTLNYDFSPGGLLNRVSDAKGNLTNYLYDATGRLSGIWAPNYGTVS